MSDASLLVQGRDRLGARELSTRGPNRTIRNVLSECTDDGLDKVAPVVGFGHDPVGSMGTDTPIAALSEKPRLLFDYFAQLFAQVTNPPLDAIREELVTSLNGTIGPEANRSEEHTSELQSQR